jgi:signal transduction histidine kinase
VRERLLAAFLSLTLFTVLLYGVPRAFSRADLVAEDAQRDVDRAAQVVAAAVDIEPGERAAYGQEVARLVARTDSVLLRRGADVQVLAGRPDAEAEALIGSAVVAGGGTVEVRRPQAVVRQEVVRNVRAIVVLGLLALIAAALAGVLLADRLARPFVRLAAHASAVGAGDFERELPPQRVREAELIAAALRDSARRLAELLARERGFARNASHQLRTPLTGMRLRLEDMSTWPETPPTVREELHEVLAEVDRLSDTVTSLLAFAREGRAGSWEQVDPGELVDRTLERWRPIASGQSRELRRDTVATPPSTSPSTLPRNAVEQVLDVLVDNALKHGRGAVAVGVRTDSRSVRFLVMDEGEVRGTGDLPVRTAAPGSPDGEGIGLGLCRDLAQSLGGRLRLVQSRPTTFELSLPVV